MDIKPFHLETNAWEMLPTWWGTALLAALLILVVGAVLMSISDHIMTIVIFLVGLFASIGIGIPIGSWPQTYKAEEYGKYVAEMKTSLTDSGFKIVSGKPNLHPNSQSDLLLRYEGQNFDCTLFTPKDLNENVIFSCGETKLSLDGLKKTVAK